MLPFSLVVCVLATLFALISGHVISWESGRIFGGEPADISEVPYQIAIRLGGEHHCGGSIIHEKFVVSAAHCVSGIPKEKLKIVTGITRTYEPGTQYDVERYHYHEKYSNSGHSYDISVIKVKGVIRFTNNVKSIRLPRSGQVIPDGTPLLVTGWGETEHGDADHLLKVVLKRVNQAKCAKIYETTTPITKDMICAHDIGKSACRGDSGGPMVLGKGSEAVLIGAVSFGPLTCVDPVAPSVYANVIELKEWIVSKTNIREE